MSRRSPHRAALRAPRTLSSDLAHESPDWRSIGPPWSSFSFAELFRATARKLLPEGWRVDAASRSSPLRPRHQIAGALPLPLPLTGPVRGQGHGALLRTCRGGRQVIAAVTGGGSSRLTDVFGASGIGKSWLVNAGVLPALQAEWRACRIAPSWSGRSAGADVGPRRQ
ncbi:hypothetical protein [Streptomyces sp. NPDC001815]|uniref:nSTAND1 domain-containing NTPase n=1 Tax=Streptomyces sp. NPDC001815 TaxID=3154526 RepID=UPI00332C7885